MKTHLLNSSAVTDQPERALAAREMRKCPALFLLLCVLFALLLNAGCSTRQAEINQLHTALAAEQLVINRDGRDYQAENEVVDRFNRQCLARLNELETR